MCRVTVNNITVGAFKVLLRSTNENDVSCFVISTNVGAFSVP